MTFRKSISVAIQDSISQQCGDRFVEIGDFTGIKNQLKYPCKTKLSPAQIEQAVQVLKGSPAILEDLRLRAMNVRTHYFNLIYGNQDILEALQQVSVATSTQNTRD